MQFCTNLYNKDLKVLTPMAAMTLMGKGTKSKNSNRTQSPMQLIILDVATSAQR